MPGFKTFWNLDSKTTFCPCGAALDEDDRTGDADCMQWYAKHTPHTDANVDENHVTGDGARVLTEDSKMSWTSKR